MPIAIFPKANKVGASETVPEDNITACVELDALTSSVTNDKHVIKQRDNAMACFLCIESH